MSFEKVTCEVRWRVTDLIMDMEGRGVERRKLIKDYPSREEAVRWVESQGYKSDFLSKKYFSKDNGWKMVELERVLVEV